MMASEPPRLGWADELIDWDDLSLVVATNVSRLRHTTRQSQNLVATKANITRSMLSHIERGENLPSVAVLLGLALALKATPNQLLTKHTEGYSYGM